MGEKVEDVIQHFVSAYYDPVKAHDYYMRTRQLTGRKAEANICCVKK